MELAQRPAAAAVAGRCGRQEGAYLVTASEAAR